MKVTILFWRELWKKITKIFSPSLTDNVPEHVLDTDDLLRRVIFTDPSYVRDDQSLSSFAFKLRANEKGISVDVSRLTTYQQSIQDRFKYRLYSVKAGYVREIGLECLHDPVEDNRAHALIVGKISNSLSKKLSRSATRIPYPE